MRTVFVALFLTFAAVAQTSQDDLPVSLYTAGGPPPQVYIIQEQVGSDSSTNLPGVIGGVVGLVGAVGALVAKFQRRD